MEQVSVTLGNTDGEIASLTISDPPTQAEVQALRDQAEWADDGQAVAGLVEALRGALVAVGCVKGKRYNSTLDLLTTSQHDRVPHGINRSHTEFSENMGPAL